MADPAPRAATPGTALGVLQRLLQRPQPASPGEHCELCGTAVEERHRHLVDLEHRSILCACRGCHLLFDHDVATGRLRAVPDRYLVIPSFELDQAGWDELQIPVSMVFLFVNSQLGRPVALYPSPAGATESELPLDSWDRLVGDDPALATLRPDVEALLVRREHDVTEAYIAPIDVCYELVGRLRLQWKGFDGGAEVRDSIDRFFAEVAANSRPHRGATGR